MNSNKYALISVSNKENLNDISKFLISQDYTIISTGGTYKYLSDVCDPSRLKQVSEITNFPEILGGRVKTLHPIISGSLLYDRNNPNHSQDVEKHNIPNIDVVVVNLYPFDKVIEQNGNLDECIENIDIGGHTLIRECVKNYKSISILTSPTQYNDFINNYNILNGGNENENGNNFRLKLAKDALELITDYDISISNYYSKLITDNDDIIYRKYNKCLDFKYGCNPHQNRASLYSVGNSNVSNNPIKVINGKLGYINLIDALHSWQLVKELSTSLSLCAAASFKHTSPAGVGTSVPLTETLTKIYGVENMELSDLAIAFIRARYADPMSSFGDFVALSHVVDESTARLIKREISDGIIAPGYSDAALEILKGKRGGKYLILQIDNNYSNRQLVEIKELYGMAITQEPNYYVTTEMSLNDIKTNNDELNEECKRDLIIANISLKYAQSNNVAYAYGGQLIGLAAGQQNRVDCVKLAGNKSRKWFLFQHPKVVKLNTLFKDEVKRQDRINACIAYINGDFSDNELVKWKQLFTEEPELFTETEKNKYLSNINGVSMASDAFFPFRDNIDTASKYGVRYIVQPGGSMADDSIVEACNEYNMLMSFSNVRMFYH